MLTCQPSLITWLYSSASDINFKDLALTITNVDVPQLSAPSTTAIGTFSTPTLQRRDGDLTQTIASGVDPTLGTFTWSNVDVSQGWYTMVATMASVNFQLQSSAFYVQNGPDVSCISTSSPSSSSAPTSSSPADPTSSPPSSPTSSGDGSSSSGVTLPVTSGASKVNRGAIAGGVIGGLAVIAAAIAAYFYLRYASASSSAPAGKRATRKWAGLGSTDSKNYPGTSSNNRHHSQSDSVGPMISHDSNVYVIGGVGADSRTSRINSVPEEDEYNAYFSPSQEKVASSSARSPFSESGHGHEDAVPLDDLITPLPGTAVTRNSSTSTSSYMNSNFSRPRSHPGSPYGSPTPEGPFSDAARNGTTSSLSHPESSYPPTPSPAFPSGTSQAFEPNAPMPTSVQQRRSSIGEAPAAGPTTRRTPRKPVPTYNPTDPALVSPPPPALSPLPSESDSSREGSLRHGHGQGHAPQPSLSHKASFGAEGRPVHYLIPDMPPPQRD
ncbi:hypothetical protein DFH06DRAFT_1180841 [Mycena polygramma]|nr:hypothetical protein DFH06DRAFT_1180841 [Mycena polygramma]